MRSVRRKLYLSRLSMVKFGDLQLKRQKPAGESSAQRLYQRTTKNKLAKEKRSSAGKFKPIGPRKGSEPRGK